MSQKYTDYSLNFSTPWPIMILLNENHPLYNRSMHISGKFKIPEKANIGVKKVNIGADKANIESEKVNVHDLFPSKTASQIEQLMEEIGYSENSWLEAYKEFCSFKGDGKPRDH